ncbi:MAG TPA: hypothetical protein VGA66_16695 [Mycobacterium sp.]|jgi:hypothetical protein
MGKRVVATVVGTLIPTSVVLLGLLVPGMRWQVAPVDIIETTTRLVIALPYGVCTDGLRNVLDAGPATVVTRGERVRVQRPTIVATADVADLIPGRTLRLFGVGQCLSLEKL